MFPSTKIAKSRCDEADRPHLYEVPAISGIVTALIVDTPLIEVLNLLLGQHGYSATSKEV